jgi:hypothetical protein
MLEPGVTITDYLLSLECAVFAWWCHRRQATAHGWYTAFFISLCLASLAGGTVHGFVPTGAWSEVLWSLVLLSIGATAVTMWGVSTTLGCSRPTARLVMHVVAVLAAIYGCLVLTCVREFWITIAAYLPAALCMSWVYVQHLRSPGPWAWGIAGVLMTFAAAGVQVARMPWHPPWFDHNALYHVLQAMALCGIMRVAGIVVAGRGHAAGQ